MSPASMTRARIAPEPHDLAASQGADRHGRGHRVTPGSHSAYDDWRRALAGNPGRAGRTWSWCAGGGSEASARAAPSLPPPRASQVLWSEDKEEDGKEGKGKGRAGA
ncbi:hypothetical protein CHLRE_09g390838v5 [Chlamydomonas reinhardtii]|uniref:Uncharacterized protein n=1 Tax=Chlamydomonas reinhardtii TaxID=3055 RepID=A0A2K3DE47_CHLRE|nr:uncharacterized protein CHLRE_09g390838v5 [Chlamydomonas reinhardtii]PNW78809.1 hypothetical protein CHLRE_09g390838v5 [Chlamydomonas reinhardtii]